MLKIMGQAAATVTQMQTYIKKKLIQRRPIRLSR